MAVIDIPSGTSYYHLTQVKSDGRDAHTIENCPVSAMRNGSGYNGCWFDMQAGQTDLLGVRAVSEHHQMSAKLLVPVAGLTTVTSRSGTHVEQGTIEDVFVPGTAIGAGRLYHELSAVLKPTRGRQGVQ